MKTCCIKRNTYDANHRPLNKTWCGNDIIAAEKVFANIDSAVLNRLFLGTVTVCPRCWDAVERLIEQDRKTQEKGIVNDN